MKTRLSLLPPDARRNIFLERAFDAVLEITKTLPAKALEETAAAGNNVSVLFKALQSPEILPELEKFEPLASPYLRGMRAQQELLVKAGGLMTSVEVAKALGLTRQAVDKRRTLGRLIAVPLGLRGLGYPACQFDQRGPVAGLDGMLHALGGADSWMQLTFLVSANGQLGNRTPLEMLRQGKIEQVIEAAGRFGEHGAL